MVLIFLQPLESRDDEATKSFCICSWPIYLNFSTCSRAGSLRICSFLTPFSPTNLCYAYCWSCWSEGPEASSVWSESFGCTIIKTGLVHCWSLTSTNLTWTGCKSSLFVTGTHKEGPALVLCLVSIFLPAAPRWQSDPGGKACLYKVNHFS